MSYGDPVIDKGRKINMALLRGMSDQEVRMVAGSLSECVAILDEAAVELSLKAPLSEEFLVVHGANVSVTRNLLDMAQHEEYRRGLNAE